MATASLPRLTLKEYLEFEEGESERHEFHDGLICAMAGGTRRHSELITDLGGELGRQIRETGAPCRIYTSQMRLFIPQYQVGVYPDVMITCDEEQLLPEGPGETLLNPVVIVEVLSESTKNYDRGDKFAYYRSVPTLRQHLCFHQDQSCVERWARTGEGNWLLTEHTGTSTVTIDTGGFHATLSLAELYQAS